MEMQKETILVLGSIPLYAIFILLEIVLSNIQHKPVYTWRNTLENIYLCLLNAGLDLLFRSLAWMVLYWFYQFKIMAIGNNLLYWLFLIVGLDFLFYVLHYVDHRYRLFWAIHVTHHSSEEFNLSVGFRSSVFQPVYRFIYFIPLPLIGFDPADIFFIYSASQIYGILLHTQWVGKLGPLEWILATPSHHRVHHGSNTEYLDKNMGMLLIIWDRLFGTFQEEVTPVRYGITKPIRNHSPVNIIFHDWKDLWQTLRNSRSFRDRLKVLFGRPQ